MSPRTLQKDKKEVGPSPNVFLKRSKRQKRIRAEVQMSFRDLQKDKRQ
ncbi:hypothetical protein SB48_HM08orf06096 [Heyndrickxia coagulans]|uniref:Uncharacterized protein n=1 Tax=Heyndrickxia coagulans TaxID=1398 RepID=A0AAN0WDT8_HEYCO|nr:hypothetical protein SB48_HM08orf06096 [Heyndrickxia coagulans]